MMLWYVLVLVNAACVGGGICGAIFFWNDRGDTWREKCRHFVPLCLAIIACLAQVVSITGKLSDKATVIRICETTEMPMPADAEPGQGHPTTRMVEWFEDGDGNRVNIPTIERTTTP